MRSLISFIFIFSISFSPLYVNSAYADWDDLYYGESGEFKAAQQQCEEEELLLDSEEEQFRAPPLVYCEVEVRCNNGKPKLYGAACNPSCPGDGKLVRPTCAELCDKACHNMPCSCSK